MRGYALDRMHLLVKRTAALSGRNASQPISHPGTTRFQTHPAQCLRHHASIAHARAILDREGFVTDEQLAAVKSAGFDDQQVVEIIAVTVFNIFTNYINHIAETEIDFPAVQLPETV